MNKKVLLIATAVTALVVGLGILLQRDMNRLNTLNAKSAVKPGPVRDADAQRVPAHYEAAPSLKELRATLPPESFNGKAREAYQAVREIPQTIAQMPCYCDRSLSHKSLHSCFEDNHAANCATCIQEALRAYALQKQGVSPTQIRERIIAEYSDGI